MNTATDSATLTSATVKAAALKEGLAAALSFADRNVYQCAGVMIQIKDGSVILAATDRYRLVEISVPAETIGQSMEEMARIPYADAKALISTISAAKLKGYSVDLNFAGDILTARVLGNSQTITLESNAVPYVHLFPLFLGDFEDGVAAPNVSLNPAFLADFAKVAGKGNPITLRFSGAGKIISVESVGSKANDLYTWRGLIMPVRVAS